MKGFGKQDQYKKKQIKKKTNKLSKEQIIHQAFKFHSEKNILEAAKYYQYFIDHEYKDHRVFSNYGVILKNKGKLQEAESLLRKAIELNPEYAMAYYNLGNTLKDLGKVVEAESSLRKAIELKSDYTDAHLNLGLIFKNIGKLQEAELSTRKAIELNPKHAAAHNNLGLICKDLGELEEAEISYRKAIKLNPDFAEAHSNLGIIFKDLGELEEAEISYRKAIKLNPDFENAHFNLGNVFIEQGKLKEAEISYRKAIKLNPDFAEGYSNLGNTLKDLGNLKEAELSYRKAIELKPNFADAQFNLGNILNDLGKLKELIHLSQSTIKSESINEEYKLFAFLKLVIANLLQQDFAETLSNMNKTNYLISKGIVNTIKDQTNRKHISTYFRFITKLYPLLEKENKNPNSEKIPHIGESHCLAFAHQTVSISSQIKKIQPVLITGGKAWHFTSQENNRWKDSLTQQIKNHTYSKSVFISFGEIDCRKDEGILAYTIKANKQMSEICENTIKGYMNYMEEKLSPNYSQKYYFGVPAPVREKELLDDIDIKRIELIKIYNSFLKKEVLFRGSYFLDVYELTSNKNGENNNFHMSDNYHLSPRCLSILFKRHLYEPYV